jgi:hypothetical protein
MNWEGFGRKGSWSNLGYSSVCHGAEGNHEKRVRITDVLIATGINHLPNTMQMGYCLSQIAWVNTLM